MLSRKSIFITRVLFSLIIFLLIYGATAINYASRQEDLPKNVTRAEARTTRQILETAVKVEKLKKTYTLQEGTEHLLQFGALFRTQILDTFGYLIYDRYDDFSISQMEALYRVYHETLERKYNIFDIVPSFFKNADIRPTKICRSINVHVHTCLKESSQLCMSIRKHNKRRLINLNHTPKIYHLAKIQQHFSEGFSLKIILKHLQNDTLKFTPSLLSGLLHNIQYDSFDDEVRTAEREVILHLTKSSKVSKNSILMTNEEIKNQTTVSGLLKIYLKKVSDTFKNPANYHAKILAEHVVREVEAISENIELFGTVYENNTINLKYLFDLILPPDVLDKDLVEAKEYLLAKVDKLEILSKYLRIEKYQQAGPDQLLMEIFGQMRDIHFAVDIVSALHTHARFWHRSHAIEGLNELLELFSSYENLRKVEEYEEMMKTIDQIKNRLWDSKNVTIEISCSNPRACLQIGLQIVMKCEFIDEGTKHLIKKFRENFTVKGSPANEACPLKEISPVKCDTETSDIKAEVEESSGTTEEPKTEYPLNIKKILAEKENKTTTLFDHAESSSEASPLLTSLSPEETSAAESSTKLNEATTSEKMITETELSTEPEITTKLSTITETDVPTEMTIEITSAVVPTFEEIGSVSTTMKNVRRKMKLITTDNPEENLTTGSSKVECISSEECSSECSDEDCSSRKDCLGENCTTTEKCDGSDCSSVECSADDCSISKKNSTCSGENCPSIEDKGDCQGVDCPDEEGQGDCKGKNCEDKEGEGDCQGVDCLDEEGQGDCKGKNCEDKEGEGDCQGVDCLDEEGQGDCKGKDCEDKEGKEDCQGIDCPNKEREGNCKGKECPNTDNKKIDCEGESCVDTKKKTDCKGKECLSIEEKSDCVGKDCPTDEGKPDCEGPNCSDNKTTTDCIGSGCPDEKIKFDCVGKDCPTDEGKPDCEGLNCSDNKTTTDCIGSGCPDEKIKSDCVGKDCPNKKETIDCEGVNCPNKIKTTDCDGKDCPDKQGSGDCQAIDCPDKVGQDDCKGKECPDTDDKKLDCVGKDCSIEEEVPDCEGSNCLDNETRINCTGSGCPDEEKKSDCIGKACPKKEETIDCEGVNCPDKIRTTDCTGKDCPEKQGTTDCSGSDCSDNKEKTDCEGSDCSDDKEETVICDEGDCSEEEESTSCSGTDCLDKGEKNNCTGSECPNNVTKTNCTGSDCPTEKAKVDCKGSNCPEKETEAPPNSGRKCAGEDCAKDFKNKTVFCDNRDPHRRRKKEKLQKMHQLDIFRLTTSKYEKVDSALISGENKPQTDKESERASESASQTEKEKHSRKHQSFSKEKTKEEQQHSSHHDNEEKEGNERKSNHGEKVREKVQEKTQEKTKIKIAKKRSEYSHSKERHSKNSDDDVSENVTPDKVNVDKNLKRIKEMKHLKKNKNIAVTKSNKDEFGKLSSDNLELDKKRKRHELSKDEDRLDISTNDSNIGKKKHLRRINREKDRKIVHEGFNSGEKKKMEGKKKLAKQINGKKENGYESHQPKNSYRRSNANFALDLDDVPLVYQTEKSALKTVERSFFDDLFNKDDAAPARPENRMFADPTDNQDEIPKKRKDALDKDYYGESYDSSDSELKWLSWFQ